MTDPSAAMRKRSIRAVIHCVHTEPPLGGSPFVSGACSDCVARAREDVVEAAAKMVEKHQMSPALRRN